MHSRGPRNTRGAGRNQLRLRHERARSEGDFEFSRAVNGGELRLQTTPKDVLSLSASRAWFSATASCSRT